MLRRGVNALNLGGRKLVRIGLTLLLLALLAGWMTTAYAATEADFLAARGKLVITPVTNPSRLTLDLAAYAGKVLELNGSIIGTYNSADGIGYLLRLDPNQMVILQAKANDPDLAVGNAIRVLARAPKEGQVLEHLTFSVTKSGAASAVVEDDDPDTMDVDRRPPVVYMPSRPVTPTKEPDPIFTDAAGLAQRPEVVSIYAAKIKEFNKRVDDATATLIAFHILDKSEQNGIDPRLTMALVARESRFDHHAVSRCGAMGLGQLMPGTAAGLGVRDAFDIPSNIDGTVRYITTQLRTFGRLSLALAAYNAGPGAVRRYNGIPPYQETQNYVRLVWETYADLAGIDPNTGEKIAKAPEKPQ